MSCSLFQAKIFPGMSQPINVDKNRWLVESDGKRFGPYTYDELKSLLANNQIKNSDRINSIDLNKPWVTVTEFFRAPILGESDVDPAMSLFDALQIAKQRAAQRKLEQNMDFAEEFVVTSKPHPSTQIWFKVIGVLLFMILVVEVVKLFPRNGADTTVANSRTVVPAQPAEETAAANLKPTTPNHPAPTAAKPALNAVQAARVAAAEKEKRDREERDRKAREAREDQEREERERAEREQDEREREEAINGREGRDADFEGDTPVTEEADAGALKRNPRHPASPSGDGTLPPEPELSPID